MKRLELVVSLSDILNNCNAIRARVAPGCKLCAVVKADAYGHGAKEVAAHLLKNGVCDAFAVATAREGAELRDSGVSGAQIIVLGLTDERDFDLSVKYGLSQTVFDIQGLAKLSQAAKAANRLASAQLKIDTGMTRVGARGEDELSALLTELKSIKNVALDGLFTHFCCADSDADFTRSQFSRFKAAEKTVSDFGFSPARHISASTALHMPEYALDMVRAGIALYGAGAPAFANDIRPAQTLISHPVRVAWAEAGETVGYGRTFTCGRRTRVITVPCGYGDGYPRALGNRARALVNGRSAKVIGNVCMDMLMLDATDAGDVGLETPVVLLGSQGGERITPDELAMLTGTIPYEIMLGFSARVERRHTIDSIWEDAHE